MDPGEVEQAVESQRVRTNARTGWAPLVAVRLRSRGTRRAVVAGRFRCPQFVAVLWARHERRDRRALRHGGSVPANRLHHPDQLDPEDSREPHRVAGIALSVLYSDRLSPNGPLHDHCPHLRHRCRSKRSWARTRHRGEAPAIDPMSAPLYTPVRGLPHLRVAQCPRRPLLRRVRRAPDARASAGAPQARDRALLRSRELHRDRGGARRRIAARAHAAVLRGDARRRRRPRGHRGEVHRRRRRRDLRGARRPRRRRPARHPQRDRDTAVAGRDRRGARSPLRQAPRDPRRHRYRRGGRWPGKWRRADGVGRHAQHRSPARAGGRTGGDPDRRADPPPDARCRARRAPRPARAQGEVPVPCSPTALSR